MRDVGGRVVARAEDFGELGFLDGGELEGGGEVGCGEGEDDFAGCWVGFAHVGGVAEAEGSGVRGRCEGFGVFCEDGVSVGARRGSVWRRRHTG